MTVFHVSKGEVHQVVNFQKYEILSNYPITCINYNYVQKHGLHIIDLIGHCPHNQNFKAISTSVLSIDLLLAKSSKFIFTRLKQYLQQYLQWQATRKQQQNAADHQVAKLWVVKQETQSATPIAYACLTATLYQWIVIEWRL